MEPNPYRPFQNLEIHETQTSRARADFSGLARSYRVLLGNDHELLSLLERYEQPPAALELWDRNDEAFEQFLDEVDRLLHNYLASATSLVDHTRRVRRKHGEAVGLEKTYDEKMREVFPEGVHSFVQDLRNYTLHRRLPVVRGHLGGESTTSVTASVNLLKSDLLAWPKWEEPARAYLGSAPDKIGLKDVIRQYTAAANTFTTWFGEAFVAGFQKVL